MDIDVAKLNEQLKLAQKVMLDTTKSNLDECTKFFAEAWKIEEDPFAPLKVSEVFDGINVPDVRNHSLTELYPHYFVRVLDPASPDYNSHHPGSAEFMAEQTEIIAIIKAMRAAQQVYNEKEYDECLRQLGERN